MKRILMMTWALLAMMGKVSADEVTVTDVTVPQGGQATLDIGFLFNSSNTYTACQFDLSLPDDVTTQKDEEGAPVVAMGDALADHDITPKALASGDDRFVVASFSKTPFAASSGTMLTVTLCADRTLIVGDSFTATITGITFSTTDKVRVPFPDVTFTITIGESRTVLDENSMAAPEPSDGPVDVRVKRTINANEWSTICLPFDMSTAQLDAAFGEMGTGWMLADFLGVESETDAGENVVGISINFGKATAIETNHPYLIKVSEAVSSFTVDGVEIDPDDEPSVDKDEYRTGAGTKKDPYVYHYNSFVGSYVKDTEIPELCLFLNGNKFYYSNGTTKMKAFRGYFDFYDVLSEVENANTRVLLVWDSEATTIAEIDAPGVLKGSVYNMNGQFMGTDVDLKSLPKGIYMVDGKKVVNY